jgi:glycine cleavage system aminomethyltransferase T
VQFFLQETGELNNMLTSRYSRSGENGYDVYQEQSSSSEVWLTY